MQSRILISSESSSVDSYCCTHQCARMRKLLQKQLAQYKRIITGIHDFKPNIYQLKSSRVQTLQQNIRQLSLRLQKANQNIDYLAQQLQQQEHPDNPRKYILSYEKILQMSYSKSNEQNSQKSLQEKFDLKKKENQFIKEITEREYEIVQLNQLVIQQKDIIDSLHSSKSADERSDKLEIAQRNFQQLLCQQKQQASVKLQIMKQEAHKQLQVLKEKLKSKEKQLKQVSNYMKEQDVQIKGLKNTLKQLQQDQLNHLTSQDKRQAQKEIETTLLNNKELKLQIGHLQGQLAQLPHIQRINNTLLKTLQEQNKILSVRKVNSYQQIQQELSTARKQKEEAFTKSKASQMRISFLQQQIERIKKEKERQKDDLQQRNLELNQLIISYQTQLETFQNKIQLVNSSVDQEKKRETLKIEKLQDKIVWLEAQLEARDQALQTLRGFQKQKNHLERNNQVLSKRLTQWQNQVTQMKEQILVLQKQVNKQQQLNKEFSMQKQDQARQKNDYIQRLTKQNLKLVSKIDQLQRQITQKQNIYKNKLKDIWASIEGINEDEDRLQMLQGELQQKQNQLTLVSKQLAELQIQNSLQKQIKNNMEQLHQQAQTQIFKLKTSLQALQKQNVIRSQLQDTQIIHLKNQIERLSISREQEKRKRHELSSELLKIKAQSTKLIIELKSSIQEKVELQKRIDVLQEDVESARLQYKPIEVQEQSISQTFNRQWEGLMNQPQFKKRDH